MPNCSVITLTALIFKRDHLLVLALLEHFSCYLCSGDKRIAVCYIFTIGKHEYVSEGRGLARIDVDQVDIDRVAFRDAKLSAASLDNCVSHERLGVKSRPKFHRWAGLANGKLERRRHYAAALSVAPMSSLYNAS